VLQGPGIECLVFGLTTLLTLSRVRSYLLVVALQGSQVLASLREFTFLHPFTNIPVHEGALRVHQIELVGESGPCLRDGGRVGKHTTANSISRVCGDNAATSDLHSAIDLGEISVGHHLGWLVADTNLEASWAPIDELDGALGLESGNGAVYVVWHNIATVKQASSHVFPIAGITFHHLVVGLEASHRDLLDRVGLVRCLSGGDNWGVGDQREMDTGVWYKVGLELVEIDVERAVEAEGSGN